jgi:hypothetical protein
VEDYGTPASKSDALSSELLSDLLNFCFLDEEAEDFEDGGSFLFVGSVVAALLEKKISSFFGVFESQQMR